jgi:hypothetical protein
VQESTQSLDRIREEEEEGEVEAGNGSRSKVEYERKGGISM